MGADYMNISIAMNDAKAVSATVCSIYIYIYIKRERAGERERELCGFAISEKTNESGKMQTVMQCYEDPAWFSFTNDR